MACVITCDKENMDYGLLGWHHALGMAGCTVGSEWLCSY